MTNLIIESIELGIYPDVFKISKVIPLHKGGEINILGNMKPISIIPSFYKIFEVVLKTQITKHFKDNNLLPTDH